MEGLIDMGNYPPLGPLPSLMDTYPPNLCLCPFAFGNTFYSLYSIYIMCMLHLFGDHPYAIITIYITSLSFIYEIYNICITSSWFENNDVTFPSPYKLYYPECM
jgi:hypothetical protein